MKRCQKSTEAYVENFEREEREISSNVTHTSKTNIQETLRLDELLLQYLPTY